ncbi:MULTISPECIES: EamA family transporter RarD [unclassified Vibrio]|uniref:EamA family transporter RarD n=1 Tax=unclassified Vibrio TaxID=2614977 RepID=UPI0010A61527|nr:MULTISPECIES: EamA family transporter RarD [unclassified Vibrio]WGY45518.1 EamA family transporter RarD [Vibrio sp. ABG19]
MQTQTNTALGVTLNVIASGFFALMFAYTALLKDVEGTEIYGWRIVLTLPLLTLFIVMRGYWPQVTTILHRIINERYFWATRILSSFLVGLQLWLFMWAPVNGYGLAVSLGYFMMPITMVVVGRFAFNDKMSRLQQLACGFAVIGVLNQLIISQTLAWPTLAICLCYPVYFWLRLKTDTNSIGGVWFDMLLSVPFSLYCLIHSGDVLSTLTTSYQLLWLVFGLGIISAMALAFQSLSAPHLNLSLFGLLIYVEPVMLLFVALLLGESISPKEWPTYIAIWLAVMALVIEGIRGLKNTRTQLKISRHS